MIGRKFPLTRQSMKCDIVTNVELVYLRLSVASLQICEQGGWLQIDKTERCHVQMQNTDIPWPMGDGIAMDFATGESPESSNRYRCSAELRGKAVEGVPCMVETHWS